MSDDQGCEIFREEAYDLLGELEATLLELEASPQDLDLVNKVFRALHTVKGSGAMFGFDDIAHFTHDLENVFDKVRNEQLEVTKDLITISFSARDHILGMLNGPDVAGNGTPEVGEKILGQIRGLLAPPAPEPEPEAKPTAPEKASHTPSPPLEPQPTAAPDLICYRILITPRKRKVGKELHLEPLFDELRKLGECVVRIDHRALPELGELDPQALYLKWEVDIITGAGEEAIRDLFMFVDVDLDVDIRVVPIGTPSDVPLPAFVSAVALQEPAPASSEGVEHVIAAADAPPERPTSLDIAPAASAPKLGEILVQDGAIKAEDLEKALGQQKPIGKILTESGLVSPEQVEQAFVKQQQTREAAAARQQKDAGTSLRVAADKLDLLVDLVGELVIVQAQVSQIVTERSDPILTVLAEQLERLSSDLRDSTLGIRMLPIGTTFSKFRRLVRDLSSELGKEVELVTKGEETELDKTVLERLGDPLVHLIRNSIDHGIDMPEERKAAGKRPEGTILLEAEHSGSEVLIRITDDGKGMDAERIRQKAVEKGLIAADAELSDQEALKLIFLPGFSTAAKVTNISGRGVGMDVVHRAIDSLRGAIEVKSAPGKGTTITIRLPLTLAIIEGLQVQCADSYYVIPLSLVEECVELHSKDVDPTRNQQIIHLRGELVPYIHLRRWFEMEGEPPAIEQIVITGVEGNRVGIVVDRVVGEHQTVIKSLGRVYRDVEGISGATIKGDGTLALILDVPRLVRSVIAETSN
ncbi:MAG: chemotaxis protein CheW [Humidesulfovibrio sp.]|uniref:chemotaxis protein CheA n=1 Tax=Humidesulfovibrio sp. TaxID=2910988 RepID=UPI0027F2D4CC|nr:chemotaxis protein CheW [Humidesulfovibrio sp.]MDQ7834539.1 chemotaxis protein CheW [Humidesulfovibrio sp.]